MRLSALLARHHSVLLESTETKTSSTRRTQRKIECLGQPLGSHADRVAGCNNVSLRRRSEPRSSKHPLDMAIDRDYLKVERLADEEVNRLAWAPGSTNGSQRSPCSQAATVDVPEVAEELPLRETMRPEVFPQP